MGDLRRLVAFDLDGTLIDSRRDLTDAANALLIEAGGAPLDEEQIGGMVGEGARLLVQRALTAAGIPLFAEALPRFLALYDERLLNHTRLYPGVEPVVHAARRAARVSVLTNKPIRPTERILDGLGIRGWFDDVVGGDGPYGRKPDPAGLRALMQQAGSPAARTLLVGDSPIDYETSRQAGVACCLVSYGFGFARFAAPPDDVMIVRDGAELLQVVQRFIG
jgi:phosphoglycolate phosphatase